MNITDYLINPMGKGSSVLSLPSRRKELDSQYKELNSKIRIIWYMIGEKNLIAHVKIPSRRHVRLYYDVLVQLDIESLPANTHVVNDCIIKVFSNCPSFTYTYAYVFNQHKDLIEWTKRKYPAEVLSKKPTQRNPYEVLSYERSLYFAFKYITSNGRNYIDQIKTESIKITSYTRILSTIQSVDLIKEINNDFNTKKREKIEQPKKQIKNLNKKKESLNTQKRTTRITPSTNKINNTKKTKKTKKI